MDFQALWKPFSRLDTENGRRRKRVDFSAAACIIILE